jgi:hypothetical protein
MAEILEIPITLTFAAAPEAFQLRSIAGAERLGTPIARIRGARSARSRRAGGMVLHW